MTRTGAEACMNLIESLRCEASERDAAGPARPARHPSPARTYSHRPALVVTSIRSISSGGSDMTPAGANLTNCLFSLRWPETTMTTRSPRRGGRRRGRASGVDALSPSPPHDGADGHDREGQKDLDDEEDALHLRLRQEDERRNRHPHTDGGDALLAGEPAHHGEGEIAVGHVGEEGVAGEVPVANHHQPEGLGSRSRAWPRPLDGGPEDASAGTTLRGARSRRPDVTARLALRHRLHWARIALGATAKERRDGGPGRRGAQGQRSNSWEEGERDVPGDGVRLVHGHGDDFGVRGVVVERVDHDVLFDGDAERSEARGESGL